LKVRTKAIFAALLVTFLWSTSWVLIKNNIEHIPPLLFAGIRYMLASLILLPGLLRYKAAIRALSPKQWAELLVYGLILYTITQGAQFITLKHMDAIPFSLMLNFTTIFVAFFGIAALNEHPTPIQWAGIVVFMCGVLLYFIPLPEGSISTIGLLMGAVCTLSNTAATIQGRAINRRRKIPAYVVTTISMTFGAVIMLGAGLVTEDIPRLSLSNWGVLAWLAAVNTAFAYSLWNRTQQTLSAVETSIINNTMLIQIAILAWVFLQERLGWQDVIGLVLAAVGILLTNLSAKVQSKEVNTDQYE